MVQLQMGNNTERIKYLYRNIVLKYLIILWHLCTKLVLSIFANLQKWYLEFFVLDIYFNQKEVRKCRLHTTRLRTSTSEREESSYDMSSLPLVSLMKTFDLIVVVGRLLNHVGKLCHLIYCFLINNIRSSSTTNTYLPVFNNIQVWNSW